MTDIDDLVVSLHEIANLRDTGAMDSAVLKQAADALESISDEIARFYAIADTFRATSINSDSPEKRMWMKIAADALDAQRQQKG